MRAGFLLWALLLTVPHAWADMTPAQAFDAGKAFGQSPQGAAAVKGAISGANAAAASRPAMLAPMTMAVCCAMTGVADFMSWALDRVRRGTTNLYSV